MLRIYILIIRFNEPIFLHSVFEDAPESRVSHSMFASSMLKVIFDKSPWHDQPPMSLRKGPEETEFEDQTNALGMGG